MELLCTLASAYAYINIPSCQWCFVKHLCQCICQGPEFPCILLCSFVHMCQCILLAHVGKLVQLAVFCCPHARGSLMFVVVFVFPGRCAESLCTHASASVRGLHCPAFCCVHLCSCIYTCLELVLVSLCSQWSAVVHMHVNPLCLLYRQSACELFASPLLPQLKLTCLWAGCSWHVAVV